MKPASLIYAFDLFKKPLFLKINHHDMTATKVGVFLSFVIYALMGYFFSQSDFFLKLQPKIITDTSSLPYSPSIYYSNRPFAIAIKDVYNNPYVDPTIFSILVESVSTTIQPNVSGYAMEVEDVRTVHNCTQNDVLRPEDYPILENSFCLDKSNFTLVGSSSEDNCTNFQVHVIMCSNSTDNNNSCKSQDEIDNFFYMKNLNLIYVNTIFQPKNYETPYTTKMTASLYKLDAKLSRLVTVKLQKATMITDETIIFPVQNSFETFQYENENSEYGMQSGGIPILSILFYSSSDQITVNRSYQSLPEAFAVLGGLFSFLIFSGRHILHLDHSLYITTLLMNFLYSFQPAPNAEGENELSVINMLSNRLQLPKTKSRKIETLEKTKMLDSLQIKDVVLTENAKKMSLKPYVPHFSLQPLVLTKRPAKQHMMTKVPEKQLKEESVSSMSHEEIKIQNPKDPHLNLYNPGTHINIRKDVDVCDSPKKSAVSQASPNNLKSFLLRSLFNGRKFFKKEEKDPKSAENFSKLNEKHNKINFNIWDYFKLGLKKIFFREHTFKDKLFVRAREVFENEIDIVKILQKVQDIEKLKHLLLSDQQIALFNVLEKPMVFFKKKKKNFDLKKSRISRYIPNSTKKIKKKLQNY